MASAAVAIYRARVNSQSLTPDEIRAAAETHRELGPNYQSAVIESFLDKVGREIDAGVDARVAAAQHYIAPTQPAPPAKPASRERSAFALAIVSISLGIPLTAITVAAGTHPPGISGLIVIWIAIAVINVAYSWHARPPSGGRR
jgi:hypothetical protein